MMNRIDQKFKSLRRQGKKAFIAFLTVGYPNLRVTEQLILAFEKVGVDIVELGVPFSDPLADGKTIQFASEQALHNHITLKKVLKFVQRLRQRCEIPLALMTYYNPVLRFGEKNFFDKAKQVGIDGVIIPDLPVEEAGQIIQGGRRQGIATIFFVSPTTTPQRLKKIAQASTGFIYYVSVTGVTGSRNRLPSSLLQHLRLVKRLTQKPLCVGFGVSTPRQIKMINRIADGVIVGSAIIQQISKNRSKRNLMEKVTHFVKGLAKDS